MGKHNRLGGRFLSEETFRIVQTIIMIVGFLGVGLLPNYFYQKKIDNFKSDLDTKLMLLGVTVEQNHGPKMETYKKFMIANYEVVKKNNVTTQKKVMDAITDLSRIIFLYGSDESIKAFINFREYDSTNAADDTKYENLALLAKLMAALRKDLNPGEKDSKAETYLRILVNDWDNVKHKIKPYL